MTRSGDIGAALDDDIRAVMLAWGVPGVAVAVVKDGQVLCAGYGVREAGDPSPVDAETIFGVGSVTKTFTGLDVALLADRGLIDWDAPIARYLPQLRYADPDTTARATVRDVAAHRVGVDSDLVWMVRSHPFEATLARSAHIPPVAPFGQFVYSNTGYASLGVLVEAVSGRGWDDFTRTEVFEPLGMTRSSTRPDFVDPMAPLARSWLAATPLGAVPGLAGLGGDKNVAAPHGLAEERPDQPPDGRRDVRVWPWRHLVAAAPAGSVNASARDLANYMLFQLGDGTFQGRRLIGAAGLAETHARHALRPAATPPNDGFETFDRRVAEPGYGLGWQTMRYRGRRIVHHAGGMPGYAANLWLSPADALGVAVLTNLDYRYNAAYRAIMERVVTHLLGLTSLREAEVMAARWSPRAEGHAVALPLATRPGLAAGALAGRYRSDEIGELVVDRDGEGAAVRFEPDCVADLLATGQPGEFVMVFRDAFRWRATARFAAATPGSPATLTLGGWSGDLQAHVLERVGDPEAAPS